MYPDADSEDNETGGPGLLGVIKYSDLWRRQFIHFLFLVFKLGDPTSITEGAENSLFSLGLRSRPRGGSGAALPARPSPSSASCSCSSPSWPSSSTHRAVIMQIMPLSSCLSYNTSTGRRQSEEEHEVYLQNQINDFRNCHFLLLICTWTLKV